MLVHGGRVFNVLQPPAAGGRQPARGHHPAGGQTGRRTAGRVFVLLVDDLHFTATETPLVRAC